MPPYPPGACSGDRLLLFCFSVCLYFYETARVGQARDTDCSRYCQLVAEEAEILLVSLAQIRGHVGDVSLGAHHVGALGAHGRQRFTYRIEHSAYLEPHTTFTDQIVVLVARQCSSDMDRNSRAGSFDYLTV